MRKKKLQYLTVQQLVFIVYFIITTAIFFFSVSLGNEGVTFQHFGGSDDGYFYWEQAKNVAKGNEWIRTSIFPLVAGTVMKVFGIQNVYLIRLMNYVVFMLLVFFSMKTIKIEFEKSKYEIDPDKKYDARILLLMMFMLYASLQVNVNLSIYRDVWIYMLYVLSTYLSIKMIFYKNNRILYFFLMVLSVVFLGEFRGHAMLSFLLALGLYFLYQRIKLLKNPSVVFVLGFLFFVLYYTFLMDFSIAGFSLRRALIYRSDALDNFSGGSQMWINLDQPNFVLFFVNYFHSLIGNLIGPLPWHISGSSTLIVFFVETIPMVIILRSLWKNRAMLSEIQRYILLQAFVWIGIVGVMNDNMGTATRLRTISWILILIVFTVTYYESQNVKKEGILDD